MGSEQYLRPRKAAKNAYLGRRESAMDRNRLPDTLMHMVIIVIRPAPRSTVRVYVP